ncbi:MAG: hypothetical protein ACXAEI_06230, partial [Candidatus Hodarchaeales archaeon]
MNFLGKAINSLAFIAKYENQKTWVLILGIFTAYEIYVTLSVVESDEEMEARANWRFSLPL